MLVGGVPEPCEDHAVRIGNMSADMLRSVYDISHDSNHVRIRIGQCSIVYDTTAYTNICSVVIDMHICMSCNIQLKCRLRYISVVYTILLLCNDSNYNLINTEYCDEVHCTYYITPPHPHLYPHPHPSHTHTHIHTHTHSHTHTHTHTNTNANTNAQKRTTPRPTPTLPS